MQFSFKQNSDLFTTENTNTKGIKATYILPRKLYPCGSLFFKLVVVQNCSKIFKLFIHSIHVSNWFEILHGELEVSRYPG